MSDNSKAIEADLRFRSLSDTVSATRDWWYSSAVSQERRENILTNEQALITREKQIIAKWKKIMSKQ